MAEDYTPLATPEDVRVALGRDLTDSETLQVDAKLKQASELFRKEALQTFTQARSTRRLKVDGGEVRLPQNPVVEVHSVTLDDGTPVEWTELFGVTFRVPLLSHSFVRVDFTHGSDEVPELVVTTVAAAVARVFGIDPLAKSGLSQFQSTTGPFSDGGTFAAWAVGGEVTLSPAEIATARGYRPVRTSRTVVHGS